jgi:hypothetical protein
MRKEQNIFQKSEPACQSRSGPPQPVENFARWQLRRA